MTRQSIAKQNLGFSLIELMVAISVASVLMLLLVEFVQMATSTVLVGEDSLFRANDAQAALDLLSGDLRSVKFVSPVGVLNSSSTVVFPQILQAYNDTTGINIAPSGNANPQTVTVYPMQLFLLSSSSGSDGTGSGFPHLIRYRLSYQDPIQGSSGNNPIMAFYRDYVSGSDTFGLTTASGTPASIGTVSGAKNTAGMAGLGDLYTGYWQVNGYWNAYLNNPPTSDLLVNNVIDFQVLLYNMGKQSTSSGNPLNSPSNVSSNVYLQTNPKTAGRQVALSGNGLQIGTPSSPATFAPYSNLVVEIKLSVLNGKGASLVNSGSLKLTDPNTLNKYAQVYMRRIPLALQ